MQATGDLVAAITELGARMQNGERQGDSRDLLLGMLFDRNTAPVVNDLDPALGQDADENGVAESGQRLVDGVVHHLIDEVMQTTLSGGADVHAWPLTYRFQSLEDGNRL
jgi:hypothetical protein